MKSLMLLAVSAAALAACSESTPPPPPKAAAQVQPAAPKVEPPKPDPNKDLAARVKQALESPDSKLPSGAIDVTAADGKVSLWGAVGNEAQRRRAATVASRIDGVKSVDNQLKVVKGS